jgi:hypothetical protein
MARVDQILTPRRAEAHQPPRRFGTPALSSEREAPYRWGMVKNNRRHVREERRTISHHRICVGGGRVRRRNLSFDENFKT